DTILIQRTCGLCHSGPHWHVFECKYCNPKSCRSCTIKAQKARNTVSNVQVPQPSK
ncbi:hypothetical protein BJ878DRAFT_422530, partial [Calycina marina]